MGVTLIGLALVKPITVFVSPALQPIENNLPAALSPLLSLIALVVVIAITAGVEYAFVAIPAQTALQEDLPVEVRGRIFGILNTLLSVASFLPVLVAPAAADLVNLVFKGAGIPVVMAVLGPSRLWIGIASWRRNAAAGLHRRRHPAEPTAAGMMRSRSWPDPSSSPRRLIAWLAITFAVVARALQAAIGLSLRVRRLIWPGAAGGRCETRA